MKRTFKMNDRVFAPLRGWYTKEYNAEETKKFSPPYGDGTLSRITRWDLMRFSPPYGDGTLNISQNIVKWKS